ncbi:MAG: glutamate--tRNA ligase [Propionibacteriaceae bacterium]|jgi:glutamyl-tRNA synthetase|nr:glutamate--tRNA ligase [Propionibacteriaceae bacterium]
MIETSTPARLRVAPSPTGDPHVGTAYMSLFNLAYAKRTGGQFILRIEDTDQARFVADSERQIFDSLRWLGLDWDEGPDVGGPYGPYRQSERLETYRPHVDQLIADGHAYHCWCSPERLQRLREELAKDKAAQTGYDRLCLGLTREQRSRLPGFSQTPVVRMLIPDDAPGSFDDLIRGEVKTPRPDDQVILKADGFPTYHLAVVVDDHLMGITHVVRGEEWISSTPKHLLLYRWLGWPAPAFCHMPLLRNADKSKISKRKNPAARLLWFREQGYLPEALLNFMELLAYPPVVADQEQQSFDQFVAGFDWAKVNTTGPIFDLAKLDWLNGAHIRALADAELSDRVIDFWNQTGQTPAATPGRDSGLILRQATPIIKERLTTLRQAAEWIDFLLVDDDEVVIHDDARAQLPPQAVELLSGAIEALVEVERFEPADIQAGLRDRLVERAGFKPRVAFTPVRVAVSGKRVSPPLFESMVILGRASCLARLRALRDHLAD